MNYKAHLISDQDIYDAYDISESKSSDWNVLTRVIYQCSKCGRLWINDHKEDLQPFVPESKCSNFLSSIKQNDWKRVLLGSWNDEPIIKGMPQGVLRWRHISDKDVEFYERWEKLESGYYRIFDKLQKKKRLRSAMLKKNNEIIHSWNGECEENPT